MKRTTILLYTLLVLALSWPSPALWAAARSSLRLPAGAVTYSVTYKQKPVSCVAFTKAGRSYVYGGKILKKHRFRRQYAVRIQTLRASLRSASAKQKRAIQAAIRILLEQRAELDALCAASSPGSSSSSSSSALSFEGMERIAGGQFSMGNSYVLDGDAAELPVHAVSLAEYFIDSHLVTNQQYAEGLNWALGQGGLVTVTNGTVYKPSSGTSYPYCETTAKNGSLSQITYDGNTFGVVSGKENYPVIMVSWYGAAAYANWRSAMQGRPLNYDLATWACNWGSGYRLPTEAEWERAARGGASGHRFSWSDTDYIDHSRGNYYAMDSYFYDSGAPGYDPVYSSGGVSMPYTSPVGSYPANAYGLYDMTGNLWEWCNDWYDGAYYSSSPAANPHGPDSGEYRVLRGGSWGSTAVQQRCAYRGNGLPTYGAIVNGFRLAISAE